MTCHSTIPAVTDMLNECLVPNCGISIQSSERSTTSCCTPFTSLPKMKAYFRPLSMVNCSREILFSTCSTDKMVYPSFLMHEPHRWFPRNTPNPRFLQLRGLFYVFPGGVVLP